MPEVKSHDISVGCRADGMPWQIRFLIVEGRSPGPSTAFVGGIFGDKPLATLALWQLAEVLSNESALCGRVILCPAANPYALEVGTRVSPDHLYLNRVFPGMDSGFITNQIANAVLNTVMNEADHVVDLHSGTPSMALWYTYDYGNLEFSSSFGYTPVVTNFAQPGQLSKAVVDSGGSSMLVEFGGGALSDPAVGVSGCLNVLKYRGQLTGKMTGPQSIPLIEGDVSLYQPSATGMLVSSYATDKVGTNITSGLVASLICPGTGETLEEFHEKRGEALLLLTNASPGMVSAGDFGAALGYSKESIKLPTS
ncbi:MAG: succinylglutamate desuccinylase/aspartoacylase family protein [Halieaceae bacterium]|nr:succinylglutamate desuccinylase/aspartoacylase family protein [Halieaceae bacterium]